ncbi:hypothetical protein SYNPS1DRAFT_26949 [Syncephalis pseudoplumigaleata]|uniref:Uncharacterized protein n=1 Tax=Syncephalis pseudoplumigaleata TaxID=1712513 RepID=A0A4P9Z6T4_9FUNG|nr:hypothetical protein SYNPS1DRAFT_26949 [Syncephalis pseudoplumigaleata]|eukprot:RKP27390.1 hypothetical protein SYNPS1DRAFT_26949 [Syncephalis pseudoplumigaleata]
MPCSRLELLLVSRAADRLLSMLDDDALLELELAGRGVQAKIRMAGTYWRGLYGRRYPWRYVTTERALLLSYRNQCWRAANKSPIGLAHSAFCYRQRVEANWRGLRHQHRCYPQYAIGGNISDEAAHRAMCASSIFLGEPDFAGTDMVCLRPSMLPARISDAPTVESSIVSCTRLSAEQLPPPRPGVHYWQSIIATNEHYTLVQHKDGYYARPTYGDHAWIKIDMPILGGFDDNAYAVRSSGRWVFISTYRAITHSEAWLVNMATGHARDMADQLCSSDFIVASDHASVTLVSYSHCASDPLAIAWRLVRCSLLPAASTTTEKHQLAQTIMQGQYRLPQPIDRPKISPLDAGYVYISDSQAYEKPIVAIYPIGAASLQHPVCSFRRVYSIFRLNRTSAVVHVHGAYHIVDLPRGTVMRSFVFSACSRIHPIIGPLCLFSHYNYFAIIDISRGQPTGRGINCLDKGQGTYHLHPSFFLFQQYMMQEVSIFDFTMTDE